MDSLALPPATGTSRRWVVLKFGGTSVSTKETWATIAARATTLLPTHDVWITVSAISQTTNRLIECLRESIEGLPPTSYEWVLERHAQLARDLGVEIPERVSTMLGNLKQILDGVRLTGEVSPRLRARVLGMGELMSSTLGQVALSQMVPTDLLANKPVAWVDARRILRARARPSEQDEDHFLEADVMPSRNELLARQESHSARLVITQGFIAASSKADSPMVLLGRGGSDTSGALFAAVLKAERYEVWTDVHGIFSSDPRNVSTAKHIREISYREAQELAAMGAKVLHPRCLGPAEWGKFVVEIHNTMDPDTDQCTRICSEDQLTDTHTTVMAVTKRTGQVLITLESIDMWGASGFLSKAFAPFDQLGISVDLIATSQYAVSMTLDHIPGGVTGEPYELLLQQLAELGRVGEKRSCAVVSIVGRRLRSVLHLMADAFKSLSNHEVFLLTESTEDLNMSFVIQDNQDGSVDQLVADLHYKLLDDPNSPLCDSASAKGLPSLFGHSWDALKAMLQGGKTPDLPVVKSKQPEPAVAAAVIPPVPVAVAKATLKDERDVRHSPVVKAVYSSPHGPAHASTMNEYGVLRHSPSVSSHQAHSSPHLTHSAFHHQNELLAHSHLASSVLDLSTPSSTLSDAGGWSSMMSRIVSDSAQSVLQDTPPRVVVSANVLSARAASAASATAGGCCYARVSETAPPSVIRILSDNSIGFECENLSELKAVRAICGFKADVVFAPGMCDLNDLTEAINLGAQLVLDSIEALCAACDVAALHASRPVVVDLQMITLETLEQLAVATRARAGLCTVSGVRGVFLPKNNAEADKVQAVLTHNVWKLWVDDASPLSLSPPAQNISKSNHIVAWMLDDALMNDAAVLLTRVLQVRNSTISVNCAVETVAFESVSVVNLSQAKESHDSDATVAGLARRSRIGSNGSFEGAVAVKVPVETKCGDVLALSGCGGVVHLDKVEWHVFETKE